ncbi:hypothetical protein D9V32_05620 [Mycetocola tolaasinivorans]|uniref:DNA-binding protein n=1 Tax=Mycetocola tolaasinivorans TaxID=76635 RepID=A0A3L7A7P8_9MICO|nr:hypothetical protein D9V32_05620 [Mycetocola tolaasinivorans]
MGEMWITVAEAATLVGRFPHRIYCWIRDGDLAEGIDSDGVKRVKPSELLRVEAAKKRGRKSGIAVIR